jgi:MOSC domain-containing protein
MNARENPLRHSFWKESIMAGAGTQYSGSVTAIWRYPVKSMLGEELAQITVTERGLFGDRVYALVDGESQKVISAKNPRKWGDLFAFRAMLPSARSESGMLQAAQITFPDGSSIDSTERDIEERLSNRLNRPVRLTASAPQSAQAEGYWPDYNWLEEPDALFEFDLPAGTFFDVAPIHLVTKATLNCLAAIAPKSCFDVARFRPNFVIDCPESTAGFVENDWVGRTLSIGDEVRMLITRPTARCVMTTLHQGGLPKDPDVLRTVVQNNQGNVGVYATVVRGGTVQRGDAIAVV